MTIVNLGKDHQWKADEDLYSGEFRPASAEPTQSGTTVHYVLSDMILPKYRASPMKCILAPPK